ncbi:hypothetical protein NQ315_007379, partial [Exocentrus adspersus]
MFQPIDVKLAHAHPGADVGVEDGGAEHSADGAAYCAERVYCADDIAQRPRQPPSLLREGESVERTRPGPGSGSSNNNSNGSNNNRQHHYVQNRVSHATSLDAIARRQCFRSGYPTVTLSNKPHMSKQFPNVSSESDLQRYRTAQQSNDRKSPSLSNPTDSLKQKFSFQDNGSVKYFQSGIHTPKMGEKVAQ